MRITRTDFLAGLLLSLAAPAAAAAATAQVQVGVRPEKARYLAGEPVFVVVDVRNVGDESIEYEPCDRRVKLERALSTVSSTLRQNVIIALGNTGSALAVPVLIRLYADDDDQSLVCGGMRILTHRRLCDGSVGESAAWRRKTLRWWTANGATTPVYGLDNCPAAPVVPTAAVDPTPVPVVGQSEGIHRSARRAITAGLRSFSCRRSS